MICTEVKSRINENNLLEADLVINRTGVGKVDEKDMFTMIQIKATRWKIYKDEKFFCYCKAKSFDVLLETLQRFEFTE